MPRADRISLTAGGLAMPPVDHLSNKGTLNFLLDRAFSGIPAGLPPDRTMVGLFMNFSRLTDKALREYDAARAELLLYVSPHDGLLRTTPYLRAIDHMENCVSAAHRAVLNARALQANKIGRAAPRLTPRQEQRLAYLRNAIEHSDEKLLGKEHGKSPAFDKPDPYSLRLANTCMVIGKNVLTYKELVSAMTKCHKTIEVIRGVPTGTPGPAFPNARLRTDPGNSVATSGNLRPTSYLQELNRLMITHS
ncbi:MAG: hypothetical protein ACRDPY_19145 [Streptosporangiaceae bacterium]